ncbi:hypothetical protein ACTXG7_09145 [Mycolicibacterium sp. Dal123E01]|uniref:hypothetical protein n=1 Tax=Mycolicibacterium sp. Dal123E01 TaxID=3457578 RepID=UPI00403ECF61
MTDVGAEAGGGAHCTSTVAASIKIGTVRDTIAGARRVVRIPITTTDDFNRRANQVD